MTRIPLAADLVRFLKDHDLRETLNFIDQYRPDTPWISPHIRGASIEPDFLPDNVTTTGPIVLSCVPAKQQDPELVEWLETPGRRTMLINLGSSTRYNMTRTQAMVGAIEAILTEQPDLQIIWKFHTVPSVDGPTGGILKRLDRFVTQGRLRLPRWLTVDPAALLETGLISVSVHHGGANCYWETVG
jgi:hypothetical protein